MYLYNCVHDNKEERDKNETEKKAQGATNTETVLKLVHKREAARATEKGYHAHPHTFNHQ
jgi:hypothetical protein